MTLPKLKHPYVYLSAEFGIDNDLPTYAGGLGILAGDTMNAAADMDMPFVGIGILYKGKQFLQHITGEGKEEQKDSEFDHDSSFLRQTSIDKKPLIIKLNISGEEIVIKPYHIRLSNNTILYFLSTDVDGNPPEWITDMDALYRGDINGKIRQQILLGVGGAKLIGELNLNPPIYHINEGRPEFIIWELTKQIMEKEGVSFGEAWSRAKEKIVYTNHTLVSAGNLEYPAKSIDNWAKSFADEMKVETSELYKEGLINPNTFSTTLFALNISKKQSAVSKIHGKYAKEQWPNYEWHTITNGVHMPRWQDSDFRKELSDKEIWDLHMIKKRELVDTVIKRTGFGYDPTRLVISWARRLAEYKQPRIIFQDLERLESLVKESERPVQILYAGNSHSDDPNAKNIIDEIIELFSTKLHGHAIFVPNYNISLANHLVSGSDVWLNTPKGNLEACGTSGMKAIANGVLNCTVIDGWTNEVDWEGVGWILDPNNVSDSFYQIMEAEIVPLYYERGENGIPHKWLERMKKSIELAKKFNAKDMLRKYEEILYS